MTADIVYQIAETLPVEELKRLHSLISKDIQRISKPAEIDANTKLAMYFRKRIIEQKILKTVRHNIVKV